MLFSGEFDVRFHLVLRMLHPHSLAHPSAAVSVFPALKSVEHCPGVCGDPEEAGHGQLGGGRGNPSGRLRRCNGGRARGQRVSERSSFSCLPSSCFFVQGMTTGGAWRRPRRSGCWDGTARHGKDYFCSRPSTASCFGIFSPFTDVRSTPPHSVPASAAGWHSTATGVFASSWRALVAPNRSM